MKHDKGQSACIAAFVAALKDGRPSPIPMDELLEVSRASVEAARRIAARNSGASDPAADD